MDAYIVDYARSPFHFAKKGGLAGIRPDDLAGQIEEPQKRFTVMPEICSGRPARNETIRARLSPCSASG